MADRPIRVQLSRRKGWRMPPNTVKVDRTTKWGNPFVTVRSGSVSGRSPMTRRMAAQSFRSLLGKTDGWWPVPLPWPAGKIPAGHPTTIDDVRRELAGKNLACWCPLREPCHADVLLEIANALSCDSPPASGERG